MAPLPAAAIAPTAAQSSDSPEALHREKFLGSSCDQRTKPAPAFDCALPIVFRSARKARCLRY